MKGYNNARSNLWKQDLIYYENERMDHDGGSHGCMREEDKKIEVLHKNI